MTAALPADGVDLGPRYDPRITPAAGDAIARALAERPETETSFACGYDFATGRLTSARVLMRGNAQLCYSIPWLLERGEVWVHNHPHRRAALPSDGDLVAAVELARHGIGSAVVTDDLSDLHMIVEPRRPDPPTPNRVRVWRVGPFMLVWTKRR